MALTDPPPLLLKDCWLDALILAGGVLLRSREGTREAPKRLSEDDAMAKKTELSVIRDGPPISK